VCCAVCCAVAVAPRPLPIATAAAMQRVMVLARHMTPRSQPAANTSNASSGASASSATAPACSPAATPLLDNVGHGTVASFPDDFFGYFGWPTLAKMDDGTLVAAASGLRNDHVCPFGRNVICRSFDHGRSWTTPTVVNDSPLDDRDTGAVNLGGGRLLLTWFTSDIRSVAAERLEHVLDGDFFAVAEAEDSSRSSANTILLSEEQRERTRAAWEAGLSRMTDEHALRFQGAWAMRSDDGGVSFHPPVPCPASAPHGPVMLRDGSLLYLGKRATLPGGGDGMGVGGIVAARSTTLGSSWEVVADVPNHVDMANNEDYHEPHLAELSDGRLLGLIRAGARPCLYLPVIGPLRPGLDSDVSRACECG
jgi:sialidase-1